MAANQINLPVVKDNFRVVVGELNQIKEKFSEIQTNYVTGTNSEWNTPASYAFMNEFIAKMNHYIEQFNKYYKAGLDRFVDGINNLLIIQDIEPMQYYDFNKIVPLEITWQPQKESFKVPIDYEKFVKDNLETKVKIIIANLGIAQKAVQTARESGLDGAFCNYIAGQFTTLKTSAEQVLSEYNSSTINAALLEDTYIGKVKGSDSDSSGPAMETQ